VEKDFEENGGGPKSLGKGPTPLLGGGPLLGKERGPLKKNPPPQKKKEAAY